jgi:drug/metabolite transporter (DMT)-like permease
VATHTYANPVVAVLLGWFLAHEPLSMRVVLATVAILGAIVLIRRGERTVEVKGAEAIAIAREDGVTVMRSAS